MNHDDEPSGRESKNNYWNDPDKQTIFWRIIASVVTALIYITAIFLFSK